MSSLPPVPRDHAKLFLVDGDLSGAAVDEVVRAAHDDPPPVAQLQRGEGALVAFTADDASFEGGNAERVHDARMKDARRHGQVCGGRTVL